MSSISQQNNFTTGQNVTATILNTEFSNIVTNINNIYSLIDDSSGNPVLLINDNRLTMGTTTAAGAGDSAILIDSEDYSDITAGDPLFTLQGDNGKESMMIKSYGTNQKNLYEGLSGRGTTASPSQTLANDFLGGLAGGGINNVGAEARQKSFFSFKASENFTTTAQGTYAVIALTPTGSTTRTESLTIGVDASSNIILTPLGGVLYTTGAIAPTTDNLYDVGTLGNRWDDVYATNGTIQTSDENDKESIQDSTLGLDFISDLRPVRFKWKKVYKKDGAQDDDLEEKTDEEKRYHYGLLAQEVEEVLNGEDFAGLIKDENSGKYGLRYNELFAPMIKAIQELKERVEELENQ